jgi:hypothetical protein
MPNPRPSTDPARPAAPRPERDVTRGVPGYRPRPSPEPASPEPGPRHEPVHPPGGPGYRPPREAP